MLAEIITIGDEILIGQIVDTNSAWMGQQLSLNGIQVHQITSVSDNKQHILTALKEAEGRADIIFITGGLGPTKDDITKTTLCEYFNSHLVFNEEAYKDVERLFHSRGREVTPINRKQAEIPANAKFVRNRNGTAPSMWFEERGKIFISMPGVPYEMKSVMYEEVIPQLIKRFALPAIVHKTVFTQGIGESFLADLLADWENSLAKHNIKLAYLPSPGKVKLRLSTTGKNKQELINIIDKKIEELMPLASEYIYGVEEFGAEPLTMEAQVGKLLLEKKVTVSTAESCTAGNISHLLTRISGSSAYYMGTVVSYADYVKENELGVNPQLIKTVGAVSKEVAEQMAIGVRKKMKTDYSISVTGIAGPSGATETKPVGLMWIAVATPTKVVSEKFLFGDHRERNIEKASLAALDMLRKELI